MNDKPRFYTSSEDIRIPQLLISMLIGLIGSIFLAYLYNLFSTFIPFIYFNVLITIGLGLAIGFATRLINRITKLTNKKSQLILAIFIAMSTYVFQWIAFLGTLEIGFAPGFGKYLNDLPATLIGGGNWDYLSDLYNYGAWSIMGITFNKFLLLLVWLIEFGIILIIPIKSVIKSAVFPFSESTNKWYPKFTLSDQFESISSKRYFLDEYHNNALKGIQNLKLGDGWRHGKVHIYILEGENDAFFSFEKIFIEGKGNGKSNSSYLIENLRISRQEAKSILNEFHNEKNSFDVL